MSLFNKNRTIKPEYIVFKDSTKKYFDKQLSLIQRNVSVCARERWRAFTCESFACLELKKKKKPTSQKAAWLFNQRHLQKNMIPT